MEEEKETMEDLRGLSARSAWSWHKWESLSLVCLYSKVVLDFRFGHWKPRTESEEKVIFTLF